MDKKTFDKGVEVRTAVLGKQYVENALKNVDDFNRPFQEFIAENVWGNIWSRPGLDRRTRALINIGMLTAMGRTEEVRIYLRAAPNIGVTREDVREVLMQTAIYCGVPAALDSFRTAQEVFREQDDASAGRE